MSTSSEGPQQENPEILIRPIDIDRYRAFFTAAHRETFRLTFGSEITDEFLEKEFARTREASAGDVNAVVGAFIDDGIAGLAILETRSRAGAAQAGWIHFYYVAPSFRRRGVGLRLVGYSAEYYRALGINEFFLRVGEDNLSAQAFYLNTGFYRIPEEDIISLNGMKELMMAFDIGK